MNENDPDAKRCHISLTAHMKSGQIAQHMMQVVVGQDGRGHVWFDFGFEHVEIKPAPNLFEEDDALGVVLQAIAIAMRLRARNR